MSAYNPASLAKYAVIKIYYQYYGQPADYKYFVVVSHESGDGKNCVLCLKATTNTAKYKNDAQQMAGCVFYPVGALSFFKQDTAIQPDNPLGIAYEQIINEEKRKRFCVVGNMPADFKAKLEAAIGASKTIPGPRKTFLLARL